MITVSDLSNYITGTTFLIYGYTGIAHWISSPISILKYHLKEVPVSLLCLNSGSAKKWLKDLWFCICEAGLVEVALCEHLKSALLAKYEHLLVCSAEWNAFFFQKKISLISQIFPVLWSFIYFMQYRQRQKTGGQLPDCIQYGVKLF